MKKSIMFLLILFISACSSNNHLLDDSINESQIHSVDPGPTAIALDVRQRGIWILGGLSDAGTFAPVAEVDLYDPVTNTWYPGATHIPTPRAFAGITSCNGKIYVIGGMAANQELKNITEVFDIASHSWGTSVSFPVPIQGLKASCIGNRVYTSGGSITEDSYGAISKIMKLNETSNYWLSLYDIGGANTNYRADGAATVLDGVLYYGGGRDIDGNYQNTNYLHYLSDYTGTKTGTAITQQRIGLAAAAYSSKVKKYVFYTGGFYASGITSQPIISALTQNTFYYYIVPLISGVAAGTMNAGTGMNKQRAYQASIVWNTSLYVFGGLHNTSVWNDFEYIPDLENANLASAAWITGGTMPRARFGGEAVTLYGQ